MDALLKPLSFLIIAIVMITLGGCSKDEDDEPEPDNNNPTGGQVVITATSPDYTFWGDELTITGTGFSTVKEENIVRFIHYTSMDQAANYSSDGGDIEIVSSTATQLKIKIPFHTETTETGPDYLGPDDARIEVSVKEKKDTSDRVKFVGLPMVGTFEYHYGWYDLGGVTRIGDSVILRGGFSGAILGAGRRYPQEGGLFEKLRLTVDGKNVPIKFRKIGSSIAGWAFFLPAQEFGEVNCTDGANGWNDRGLTFRFSIEGTDKKDERQLFVQYLPEQSVTSVDGPLAVSKEIGGVPALTVHGDNMYYTTARFVPGGCGVAATSIGLQNAGIFANTLSVGIPLSQMAEECTYTIYLVDPCDNSVNIGTIKINP